MGFGSPPRLAEVAKYHTIVLALEKVCAGVSVNWNAIVNRVLNLYNSQQGTAEGKELATGIITKLRDNAMTLSALREAWGDLATATAKAELATAKADLATATAKAELATAKADLSAAQVQEPVLLEDVLARFLVKPPPTAPGQLWSFLAANADGAKFLSETLSSLRQAIEDSIQHLGQMMDKSKYGVIATFGVGGMGKTELLQQLRTSLDVMGMVNMGLRNVNSAALPVKEYVPLFATFNAGSPFNETVDTPQKIVSTTIARFLTGEATTPMPADCDFRTLAEKIRRLRQQEVLASTGTTIAETEILIVLLVDEIMKLEKSAMGILMDALAAFHQTQMQGGLPTLVVITSLKVKPVVDHYETASSRLVFPVKLTELDCDEKYMEQMIAKILQLPYGRIATDGSQPGPTMKKDESAVIRAMIGVCSGHPRNIERQFEAIKRYRERGESVTFQYPRSTSLRLKHMLFLWRLVGCECRNKPALFTDLDDVAADCLDRHAVTYQVVDGGRVRLRPCAAAWLKYTPDLADEPEYNALVTAGSIPKSLNVITAMLQKSLSDQINLWEETMLRIMYLRAQAMQYTDPSTGVLLKDVLCHEELDATLVVRPAPKCIEYVNNFNTVPTGVVSFALAEKTNEKAIESRSVNFVYKTDGAPVVLLVQNKLVQTMSCGEVLDILSGMVARAQELNLTGEVRYLLFTTGDSYQLESDLRKADRVLLSKSIIVTTKRCIQMLHVFGASLLFEGISGKSRPSMRKQAATTTTTAR